MAALSPVLPVTGLTENKVISTNTLLWRSETYGFSPQQSEAPMAYIHGIYNATSSWNDPKEKCERDGQQMFTLDSYEQWHILVENHQTPYYLNHKFWMATMIFIGKPQIRSTICRKKVE